MARNNIIIAIATLGVTYLAKHTTYMPFLALIHNGIMYQKQSHNFKIQNLQYNSVSNYYYLSYSSVKKYHLQLAIYVNV